MRTALWFTRRLRRHGIKFPIITYQEAKRAGLPLAVLAAVLEQETGGGKNVFGHDIDPVNGRPIWHGKLGVVPVTKKSYRAYKTWRDQYGHPPHGRMQGVGPMQLTWYTYQDAADKLGGCWKPRPNIRVGCEALASNIKKHGLRGGLRAYNGSWVYADDVQRRIYRWKRKLNVEPRQGFDSLDESMWEAYTIGRRRGFTDLGTYANKSGSHGYRPAVAFDLGDPLRFKFLGWGYLKARNLAKFYAKNGKRLGLEYVLLGHKMLHRENGWKPVWFADSDGSHKFHIHVDGLGPDDT